MDRNKIEKFKKILENKKKELLQEIIEDNELMNNESNSGETYSEEYDLASAIMESELKENIDENNIKLLKKIDYALERIENGTYGVCSLCGKEISEDRLEFIPYTEYCKECAKKKRY